MQQEQEALNRIWNRIADTTTSQYEDEKGKVIPMHDSRITYNRVSARKSHTIMQRIGTLAAIVFLVVLVGGMALVFNAARQSSGSSGCSGCSGVQHVTPQATSALAYPAGPIGKIVYSTKVSLMDGIDAYGLNWSPASNRIGEATLSARSWDATTGKNVVSYGPQCSGSVFSVVWSPDGKSIASAGDHIELWHVANGKTYYTFTKNASTIRVLTWSPNGHFIVSTDSPETSSSTIQVWIAN